MFGHEFEALSFAILGERLTRRMCEAAFKDTSKKLVEAQTVTELSWSSCVCM